MVEGSGFKFLVHSLNPSYRVPCRKTVSKYMEKIYNEHKAEIIDCMRGKVISLTSDMWTSAAVPRFHYSYWTFHPGLGIKKYCNGY